MGRQRLVKDDKPNKKKAEAKQLPPTTARRQRKLGKLQPKKSRDAELPVQSEVGDMPQEVDDIIDDIRRSELGLPDEE